MTLNIVLLTSFSFSSLDYSGESTCCFKLPALVISQQGTGKECLIVDKFSSRYKSWKTGSSNRRKDYLERQSKATSFHESSSHPVDIKTFVSKPHTWQKFVKSAW